MKTLQGDTFKVLVLKGKAFEEGSSSEVGRRFQLLMDELKLRGMNLVYSNSFEDVKNVLAVDKSMDCLLVDWSFYIPDEHNEDTLLCTIKKMHERQPGVPVFIISEKSPTKEFLGNELLENINETIWILQTEIDFMADRIADQMLIYRDNLLPPLAKAVFGYNKLAEYSWAAPGHQGGVGFTKTAVGKKFFDFYDENLFRTDTGIERSSIGSLLDHEGAFLDSEKNTARIFGADRSYNVLVGTSGSNRTIMQACLTDEDIALVDRNCHKSIEQGLIITGAKPVYMIPTRNRYGIIGPIHPDEMKYGTVKNKIAENPLTKDMGIDKPVYSVVTNCTYDGVCYDAAKAEAFFQEYVKRIHFDEAWYGYARFFPLYKDHFGMRGNPKDYKGQATVFATHSTHKLLNALSQASYVHMRQGQDPISEDRFNQSYMMHATTSPLYAIAVSNDVGSAMMDGETGPSLVKEALSEAIYLRKEVARLHKEYKEKGSWFFTPWNAEVVTDPASGKKYAFEDAPLELLLTEQSCWTMNPEDKWHGFEGIPKDWAMLDPLKVSILAPGMGEDGKMLEEGVPANLVAYYFAKYGVVPTRVTDFQVMFLVSLGVSEGKSSTLVDLLVSFKKHYDNNTLLKEILPELVKIDEARYGELGLQDLGKEMFKYLKENNPGQFLNAAYSTLPKVEVSPRGAFNKIVKNDVELVPADKLIGRVAANSVIPYPPGIPMLMSGENFGDENSPHIRYLKELAIWDKQFPGFEKVTEGSEVIDGVYNVLCLK